MQTIEYWRKNKDWQQYLGKRAEVIAQTLVHVSAQKQEAFLPYPYLIVDLGIERKELMGVLGESFQIGDQVELVLRKLSQEDPAELISYGLKARKVKTL